MPTRARLMSCIFGIVVVLIGAVAIASCGGDGNGDDTNGTENGNGNGEELSVTDTGGGLGITSGSSGPLMVRVVFIIPSDEPGYVTNCNPFGPPEDRNMAPLPEDPSWVYDQPLAPGQTLSVSAANCQDYTGYSVWARNTDGELVFEHHE